MFFRNVITAISLSFMLLLAGILPSYALEGIEFTITNECIGRVCIGDTVETAKKAYKDAILKVNTDRTGYYVFDSLGNFLLEFSTKRSLTKDLPILYLMTSNPLFSYNKGNISPETKISLLSKAFGNPTYENGPNGYTVSFPKWQIKENTTYKNYKVNFIVSVYNAKLSSQTQNSLMTSPEYEMNILKKYPQETVLNTFEIYSDYFKNGKATIANE